MTTNWTTCSHSIGPLPNTELESALLCCSGNTYFEFSWLLLCLLSLSQHVVDRSQEYRDLDRSPIHCRAHIPFTHTLSLESPANLLQVFLFVGGNLTYPVVTHMDMVRSCKLHTDRPSVGIQTQYLLAVRWERYSLHHHFELILLLAELQNADCV